MNIRALVSLLFVLAATVWAAAVPSGPTNVTELSLPLHNKAAAWDNGGINHGICSFHFKVWHTCFFDRVNPHGSMGNLIDGAGEEHVFDSRWPMWDGFLANYEMKQRFGDNLFETASYSRQHKMIFFYNHCGWNQDDRDYTNRKYSKCGRCEVGEWTRPPLRCTDKNKVDETAERVQDMDCFFPC